nr:translational initiation factor 1 [Myosoton aquaticum]YP_010976440.1 translational initiation factor 1 [Stellaria neglecta]WNX95159.1 translational initiation factor 1 [Myosoton aquaticum]WNX95242.1 translational initiation factor 1 [Stellaria neglecta]
MIEPEVIDTIYRLCTKDSND